jgi:hypothetical protein
MLLILMSLETQEKSQATKRSSYTRAFANARLLLRADARRTRRAALSVPAAARCSCGASGAVAVLLDVGFLVGVFLVLADTEDGEDRVEEGARAAEEAEQEEQEYAEDDADDDTSDGAAR